jgi:hypothetical protein
MLVLLVDNYPRMRVFRRGKKRRRVMEEEEEEEVERKWEWKLEREGSRNVTAGRLLTKCDPGPSPMEGMEATT